MSVVGAVIQYSVDESNVSLSFPVCLFFFVNPNHEWFTHQELFLERPIAAPLCHSALLSAEKISWVPNLAEPLVGYKFDRRLWARMQEERKQDLKSEFVVSIPTKAKAPKGQCKIKNKDERSKSILSTYSTRRRCCWVEYMRPTGNNYSPAAPWSYFFFLWVFSFSSPLGFRCGVYMLFLYTRLQKAAENNFLVAALKTSGFSLAKAQSPIYRQSPPRPMIINSRRLGIEIFANYTITRQQQCVGSICAASPIFINKSLDEESLVRILGDCRSCSYIFRLWCNRSAAEWRVQWLDPVRKSNDDSTPFKPRTVTRSAIRYPMAIDPCAAREFPICQGSPVIYLSFVYNNELVIWKYISLE